MKKELTALDILSSEECETVAGKIHELRPLWNHRHPQVPFFTLGIASYLDAEGRADEYREKATRLNPKLREHFGWLYDRIAHSVGEHLQAPVLFDETRLALPGFHVFQAHPAFRKPFASVHFDYQYRHLDWTVYGKVDVASQLSLTLSIRLPTAGGGLRVWEIDSFELEAMSEDERARFKEENREGRFVAYKEGSLVMHSGHQLHQIAPASRMDPMDERITLQAHALSVTDGWLLYW